MKYFLPLFFFLFFSCNSTNTAPPTLDFKTTESQKNFLEEVLALDQETRNTSNDVQQKHGYNSPEYKAARQKMQQTDRENLVKIEAYLAKYGHPTLAKHGKQGVKAPYLVIHHSSGSGEVRKRNFHYVYEAWKKGDLRNQSLSFYLNRYYAIVNGERLEMESPFREEDELKILIKELDLEGIAREVDEKLGK